MTQSSDAPKPTAEPKLEKKPGFFTRIIDKLDNSMKLKAEEKSQKGCCGGKGKDGKCC